MTKTGTGSIFRRRNRHGNLAHVWSISYMQHGQRVREATRTESFEEAKDLLKQRIGEVAGGTLPTADRRRLTVKQVLGGLVADYELNGRASLGSIRSEATTWTRELGDLVVVQLTTDRVRRVLQDWRKAGKSAGTCNRYVAALARAVKLARIPIDPGRLSWADLRLDEHAPRGRYIPPAEATKITRHLPPYLRDAFAFSYATGVRRGQLLGTEWSYVDTKRWIVTWPPSKVKARRPHVLHLAGDALAIVKRRLRDRRDGCAYVFHHNGRKIVAVRKTFAKAVKDAGLPYGRKAGGIVWHGTRHSAVTNLSTAGVPQHEAMGISGHSTPAVFARYNIGQAVEQRRALELVSRRKR